MTRDTEPEPAKAGDRESSLERPAKLLFSTAGLTRSDLADYFNRIAPQMLPHLRDRALTLQRLPDGVGRDGFFQKRVPDDFPGWIERLEVETESGSILQALAGSARTLAYLGGQGCVTLQVPLARRDRPRHPDRLVFDLDPSDDDFEKVRAAARRVRGALGALGLACFLQTTGSRGLHVVVPLDRSADFDAAGDFAGELAALLVARCPDELTTAQRKSKRGTRVYLDVLRNAYGQTVVAPYSVRARPEAPIATPIAWSELRRPGLGPRSYTIRNIFRRLGQRPCPWRNLDRRPQNLGRAREALRQLS